MYCLRSLQSTGPLHHPGTAMASSRSGACLIMRRRMIPLLVDERFCWLLGLPFGDGSLSRQQANPAYLCLFGDLPEEPRTGWRTSAVSVASRMPSTASTCTMNCWHPGCTGMGSPVTAFRSRAPSAGCRANPTGEGDLAGVPADRDAHRAPVTVRRLAGRSPLRPAPSRAGRSAASPAQGLRGCTRPHTRMPRPCTRVKERKGRGIHAFARCPQPSLRVS